MPKSNKISEFFRAKTKGNPGANLHGLLKSQHEETLRDSMAYIRQHPERVNDGWRYASCAKYLERVGDHAKNLAEQIIYIVKGTDVRHNPVDAIEDLVR